MIVFKFGGGILKDAQAIVKLSKIIQAYKGKRIIIVLSAMNKSTNKLEALISEFLHNRNIFYQSLQALQDFHLKVLSDLNLADKSMNDKIEELFEELQGKFFSNENETFDVLYDQVVCYGEIISSALISGYLNQKGIKNSWLDIRKCMITDDHFRSANVNFNESTKRLNDCINDSNDQLLITQGFIGSTPKGLSTTLGREGSDYTAALLGSMVNSERVIFWKDVKGIFNGDPKHFENAVKIPRLSYSDATEMTRLGAKVLHHKSITPLQEKRIKLEVKLFDLPLQEGSIVHSYGNAIDELPLVIHRFNKVILKVRSGNFLDESDRRRILDSTEALNLEVNFEFLKPNVFYMCLNYFPEPILHLIEKLNSHYQVEITNQVVMVKIKNGHFLPAKLFEDKQLLISEIKDNIHFIFFK